MEPLHQLQNKHYVYYLIDPKSNLPFYVGKGQGKRMYDHEHKVRKNIVPQNNLHLFHKINKIIGSGGLIGYVKVDDELDEPSALKLEISEIKRLGRNNLCNLTDGGEGMSGWKHSNKSKSIMSVKRKVWFNNPEHRRQTSETTRNSMFSSGYVDRVSKEITMVSPDGIVTTTKNISKFCRDNNLQNGNLYKVLNGKMKSHRGWSLPRSI